MSFLLLYSEERAPYDLSSTTISTSASPTFFAIIRFIIFIVMWGTGFLPIRVMINGISAIGCRHGIRRFGMAFSGLRADK